MDVKAGLFYVFAALLLFAAFRVVTARNPELPKQNNKSHFLQWLQWLKSILPIVMNGLRTGDLDEQKRQN